MMQGVHVGLNLEFPCKGSVQLEAWSFHQEIGLKFKEETSEVLIWQIALCGGETLALRTIDQK